MGWVHMAGESGKINIRLLGPFSAHVEYQSVAPSAAKQRQILALLALRAGRVVTIPTLLEELWGDDPPRTCATTLQTYILQLRNKIASAVQGKSQVRQILTTRHGGYLLDEAACEIDANEFDRLARAGRAAAENGDQRMASDQLAQALRLWRGPTLADVPAGPVLELEVTALEETRLAVLERRLEADLSLRRHADLLGELTVLSAKNPMNENFCALLMISLYRSGYVGRALEAYQRLRAVLRDELGVEPCPRLRHLQQAILSRAEQLDSGGLSALTDGASIYS